MGKHDKVTVSLILKKVHPNGKGAAFWDREYGKDEKPKWGNLPTSQIEFDEDASIGSVVEVTLPEWLANNEGLI